MKFNSKYGTKNEVVSNPGNKMRTEYQLYYDENGSEDLKVIGETDTDLEIQSHAESVDIKTLINRYTNGDYTALERAKGFYADVANMPVNFAEVMNINIQGKQLFDQFPKEYKDLYGNDYQQFINDPKRLFEFMDQKNSVSNDEEVKSDDNEK